MPLQRGMLRRLAFCAAAACLLLALAWWLGGQRQLGRLDPALVIPWLMPLLLWQAWRWRFASVWPWLGEAAGLLLLLLAAQAAMLWAWTDAPFEKAAPQLAVTALAAALCAGISWAMRPVLRAPALLAAAVSAALTLMWLVGAHGFLSIAYRPAPADARAATAVMMTSLPLRWAGSDDFTDIFSGRSHDDIFLQQLEHLGPVSLVDSLAGKPPSTGSWLFLAHPPALTPQDLVAVDSHVRGGGRALILADALSSWPAVHPLGDPRNPPITSLLTPLLDHWGIKLNAATHAEGGAVWLGGDGAGLWLHSSGRFAAWPPSCQMITDNRALRCRIGRGQVVILGDADLLYAPLWQADGWDAAHLMKSDILYWTAQLLWGPYAGRRWLHPLWISPAGGGFAGAGASGL